jgi:hypothetical protein
MVDVGRRASLVVGLTQGLAESTPRAPQRPGGNHGRGREVASVGIAGPTRRGKGRDCMLVLFTPDSNV